MKKENVLPTNVGDISGRITRSRAAALCASGRMPSLRASAQLGQKHISRAKSKRAALDENNTIAPDNAGNKPKKRAVLQDVTNVCCENSYRSCFNATRIQVHVLHFFCIDSNIFFYVVISTMNATKKNKFICHFAENAHPSQK